MKINSNQSYPKKFIQTKASFNKIQSWLQELQSIQNTQRMLLTGGSKMFQGSKLKNKNKNLIKNIHQHHPIQINNSTKVFKISSFQDHQNQLLSKTFTPYKKQPKFKPRNITTYSQSISPKQKQQNVSPKFFHQRQTFKLNTKQLLFKMKRIKRVQSASQPKSFQSNKDKIAKILSWKVDLVQKSKGEERKVLNEQKSRDSWSLKKLKTSPSTPKVKQNINDSPGKQKLELNDLFKNKLQKVIKQSYNQSSNREIKKQRKQRKQRIDPRIKLQLHITQKLFLLQRKDQKARLILNRYKQKQL